MAEKQQNAAKGCFTALVVVNKKIGSRFYKLVLHLPKKAAVAFGNAQPGQFTQIDISSAALPPERAIPKSLTCAAKRNIILPRPFSFSDVSSQEEKIHLEIIYCVLGPATLRLTTVKPADTLNIIGPLGNGFSVPPDKTAALLVAGGIGAAPLQYQAKMLSARHPEIYTVAFVGAKSKSDLPFEGRIDKFTPLPLSEQNLKAICHSRGESMKFARKSAIRSVPLPRWVSNLK